MYIHFIPLFIMITPHLTIRLDPRLKAAVMRQAKRDRLSLSDAMRLLLFAYAKGEVKLAALQETH